MRILVTVLITFSMVDCQSYFKGFSGQNQAYVVDIERYAAELGLQGIFRNFISENFDVYAYDYGNLGDHARNCSAFISEQIVFRCNDGWISVGRLDVFFAVSENKNNGKNYDFSEKYSSVAEYVMNVYNHSMFVNPHTSLFTVMHYI